MRVDSERDQAAGAAMLIALGGVAIGLSALTGIIVLVATFAPKFLGLVLALAAGLI